MRIREVCERTSVSQYTLRYYEKIGLLDRVNRTESGIRDYQEQDLRRLELIKYMRGLGLGIEPLHRYIALAEEGEATLNERKEILLAHKQKTEQQLLEAQLMLDKIETKLSLYDAKLKQPRKEA